MSEKTNVKPVFKARAGLVTATVWENIREKDDKKMTFYNTDIVRNYKDGEDWKITSSFSLQDLANVESVARKVREYLTVKIEARDKD